MEIAIDNGGKTVFQKTIAVQNSCDSIIIPVKNLRLWSPEKPLLYNLKIRLKNDKQILSEWNQKLGIRSFTVKDKKFFLNGNPCVLRAGTVVWHRWVRDDEGKSLAWDKNWFLQNVILRLKNLGANAIRFHLGNPPERLLDLCDQYGLLVQYEWPFFHGIPASEASLLRQFPQWLNAGLKHPSVVLIHPYNETGNTELPVMQNALNQIIPNYPPFVLADRDVIHIHKYWWSLFENVGIYYDSYRQFPKAIMADEFGGNYLDGNYNPGKYPALQESFLRFLGKNHTAAEREELLNLSNSRIAEYWRRIGAAGFSPFCILGSENDGNHWFTGKLNEGNPKSVWDKLTAAYSPVSISMDCWHRNFTPEQIYTFPVYFFNDTDEKQDLQVLLSIEDESGKIVTKQIFTKQVAAYQTGIEEKTITMPEKQGRYTVKAKLINQPAPVKSEVVSEWKIRVLQPVVPLKLKEMCIGVDSKETELIAFLQQNKLSYHPVNHPDNHVILYSRKSWEKIEQNDTAFLRKLNTAIEAGKTVILLDAGMQLLGQAYQSGLGNLQGADTLRDTLVREYPLPQGLSARFTQLPEPESHLHLSNPDDSTSLLFNLKKDYLWLWNGLRGGLIAPAVDMEISGLNTQDWIARGADPGLLTGESYFAYELQGYFAFSTQADDEQIRHNLRNKVKFIAEDAPSLAPFLHPDALIKITNVIESIKRDTTGNSASITPLYNCGKNLFRSPVVKIDWGKEKGQLIISQLITQGRLLQSSRIKEQNYQIVPDAVAVQTVLNLINYIIK